MIILNEIIEQLNIKDMIYEVRGKQVMLDSDLAKLYGCKNGTKEIKQAIKNNPNKFPERFCFQITENEYRNLRSKKLTSSSKENYGGRRYLPRVFTEQGVAMLATILKSPIATKISISIMDAFVEMRNFINENKNIFSRMINIENNLDNMKLEYDNNFNKIFDAMEEKEIPKEKIFFDGQIYDAYSLIIDLIINAKNRIIIIDNYIDKTILDMLSYKNKLTDVIIVTKENKLKELDINKFNQEYPFLKIIIKNTYHDRFIIIDNNLYHIGASLKDLGKKVFAINKIEDTKYLNQIINNIGDNIELDKY